MWYFDSPGFWSIAAEIEDNSGLIAVNNTETVFVNSLFAWELVPRGVNWTNVVVGFSNQISDNNLTIRNIGNTNITNVTINGTYLEGQTTSSETIPVGNFAYNTTASCSGYTLIQDQNVTAVLEINYTDSTFANPSNKSLEFCLKQISGVSLQNYVSVRDWIIDVIFSLAAITLARKTIKKKKKKQKSKQQANERITQLEKRMEKQESLIQELLQIVKKEPEKIQIPTSIFKQGKPASILCKYLKEKQKMKLCEIARLLNRDQRTIWNNYKNSKKEKLVIKETSIRIPISVFSEKRLSVLEAIVYYYKMQGMKNAQIAKLLGKDPRNVWTIQKRAKKKLGD
jgi:DNA-binding CsgD family transcriptional regulator